MNHDRRLTAVSNRLSPDSDVSVHAFPATPTPWASTYRLVQESSGDCWVVRLIDPALAERDVVQAEFAAARLLGEQGLSPAVLHADPEAAVLVMEYVDGRPARPVDLEQALSLAGVLRRLHALSWDDAPRLQVRRWIEAGEAVGLLVKEQPELALYGEAAERFHGLRSALASLQVPDALCHNDLNPGNVLFDRSRAWLVDFDHLGLGDPLFDVATAIMSLDMTPAIRAAFLDEYLGREIVKAEEARVELLSCLVLLRYGISALSLVPIRLHPRTGAWTAGDVGEAFVFDDRDDDLGWAVFRLSLGFVSAGLARLGAEPAAAAHRTLGLTSASR